jgi:uncharacterized protein YbjT (DUF2867 family)
MTAQTTDNQLGTEARTGYFPPILVTGGTGTLGRLVVAHLRDRGLRVRAVSRHGHEGGELVEYVTGDLDTGEGVDAAVQGVRIVIHCAGGRLGDDRKAATLVAAASRAGVRHVVNISVVGADRVPIEGRIDRAMFGYFGSKRAAEEVIAASGIPWTTLRATQFHELVLMTVRQMARLPVIPVPSARFQPVAGAEVAARLVDLALDEPASLVSDIAGPHIYTLRELARSYVRARGMRRVFLPLRVPGAAARAVRAGANLAPDRAVGRMTWEEFLAAQGLGSMPHSPARTTAGAAG